MGIHCWRVGLAELEQQRIDVNCKSRWIVEKTTIITRQESAVVGNIHFMNYALSAAFPVHPLKAYNNVSQSIRNYSRKRREEKRHNFEGTASVANSLLPSKIAAPHRLFYIPYRGSELGIKYPSTSFSNIWKVPYQLTSIDSADTSIIFSNYSNSICPPPPVSGALGKMSCISRIHRQASVTWCLRH